MHNDIFIGMGLEVDQYFIDRPERTLRAKEKRKENTGEIRKMSTTLRLGHKFALPHTVSKPKNSFLSLLGNIKKGFPFVLAQAVHKRRAIIIKKKKKKHWKRSNLFYLPWFSCSFRFLVNEMQTIGDKTIDRVDKNKIMNSNRYKIDSMIVRRRW